MKTLKLNPGSPCGLPFSTGPSQGDEGHEGRTTRLIASRDHEVHCQRLPSDHDIVSRARRERKGPSKTWMLVGQGLLPIAGSSTNSKNTRSTTSTGNNGNEPDNNGSRDTSNNC